MKQFINIILVGPKGHGKSTLAGRILLDLNKVTEVRLEDVKKEAVAAKKPESFLAFLVDRDIAERAKGQTINLSYLEPIKTNGNIIKLVDSPGDPVYVTNSIEGLFQSDVPLIVIDVDELNKKQIIPTSDAQGIPELYELFLSLYSLNFREFIFAINKMDTVNYSQDVFENAVQKIKDALVSIGFGDVNTVFIPVSALNGENIVSPSKKMDWYTNKSLLQNLSILKSPKRYENLPFRLPIFRTFMGGRVVSGVVMSGKISLGEKIVIMPPQKSGVVRQIEHWGESLNEVTAGLDVGIEIGLVQKQFFSKGYIVSDITNPPSVATRIKVALKVFNRRGIWVNYAPLLYVHALHTTAKIVKLEDANGNTVNKLPQGSTGYAVLEIKGEKAIAVDTYEENPVIGRILLKDSYKTVAGGKIIEIL